MICEVHKLFHPMKLETVRQEMKALIPLPEEAIIDSKDIDKVLNIFKDMEGKNLYKVSMQLTGRYVDAALLALNSDISQETAAALIEVLRLRRKKRHFKLCWLMLQQMGGNTALEEAFRLLCSYMELHHGEEYETTLVYKTGPDNILNTDIILKQIKNGETLEQFFISYELQKGSKLRLRLSEAYFKNCTEEGFKNNHEILLELLESCGEVLSPEVVRSYLLAMAEVEYAETVAAKFVGFAAVQGGIREYERLIGQEAADKLEKWTFIAAIRLHIAGMPRAEGIWTSLYQEIENVLYDDKSKCLYLYFKKVVAVLPQEDCHYIVRRKAFNLLYEKFSSYLIEYEEGGFIKLLEDNVGAREGYLEDVVKDVYRINYEDAGLLYIREFTRQLPE